MDIAVLGIDLGKNVCSVVGLDGSGRVMLRRRVRREMLERLVDGLPRCVVAMEACCGAHHLGRVFGGQGHEVRLMSPEYARPYVKAQKNDDRDAEAIAEAATRPTMRFVPVKSVAQSDVQALHRGARAVLPRLADQPTPLGRWARGLLTRAPKNVAIVALANKLARIVWAVLAHGRAYDAEFAAA
ncbi:MAG: transposase [Defluviicoccus sp.]|nr:MAG: transposase [Defluviicoccus sp.]